MCSITQTDATSHNRASATVACHNYFLFPGRVSKMTPAREHGQCVPAFTNWQRSTLLSRKNSSSSMQKPSYSTGINVFSYVTGLHRNYKFKTLKNAQTLECIFRSNQTKFILKTFYSLCRGLFSLDALRASIYHVGNQPFVTLHFAYITTLHGNDIKYIYKPVYLYTDISRSIIVR